MSKRKEHSDTSFPKMIIEKFYFFCQPETIKEWLFVMLRHEASLGYNLGKDATSSNLRKTNPAY
jgi:hypothetical protein